MDRNSNADDVFGRLLFTGAHGQSTAPTGTMVPGMNEAHEYGLQEDTARRQETSSNPRCDDVCGGCDSHSSLPHRMGRAITNQPLVHGAIGQRDSHISFPTREGDLNTDRQQPGNGPLEQRDTDGLSRPLNEAQGSRQNSENFWLPFCARRTASLLFMATFALMAAMLEVLFALCRQNSGLSQSIPTIRYSWSYGTTGILTLTAALWHRLDYERRVLAPWLRPYPIATSKAALLVDYINAWPLVIPFQALRNQDYEVVYSSTRSLLLQVLIVLSTALFTLAPSNLVNEAEPIFLTSRFVDDPARLKHSESLLAYYITMGNDLPYGNLSSDMLSEHWAHPEGCTNQFAYQTFEPTSSVLKEVNSTVDGLALRLSCETGNLVKRVQTPKIVYVDNGGAIWMLPQGDGPAFVVEYQGCQATIGWDVPIFYPRSDLPAKNHTREHGMVLRGIPGFSRNECNSTEQAHHRLVFLSAEVEWLSNNESFFYEKGGYETVGVNIDMEVTQAVALVCTPSLEQTLLEVSRSNDGVQSVSPHGRNPTAVLGVIQPWDFIDFFLDKPTIERPFVKTVVGNTTVHADITSRVVLAHCGQSCLGASGVLNDTAFLQNILATFMADYGATTAHTMLKERFNVTSTGTSSSIVLRLWVQPLVCQAMVALLAVITLTILAFQFKHQKKLTRKAKPGSIAATAILAGQVATSSFPKDLGAASTKDLPGTLDGFLVSHDSSSSYQVQHSPALEEDSLTRTAPGARSGLLGRDAFQNPLPLRPVSYIALVWAIVACGTTLVVLLRKSTDEQGLGDAAVSEYLLFAWTMVPATILTVIPWWLSSIDTQIRLLAPYHLLKSRKGSNSVLRLDLLRGLVPIVLYQELKASNFAATSTTLAALLGAVLTTVSAAMFQPISFPVSRTAELSPNTVFMSPTPQPWVVHNESNINSELSISYIGTSGLASSILETNLSYPRGSYQDLVFPEFSMTALKIENASEKTNASSAIVKVTAPALRPRLSCRVYSPRDIAAVYVYNYPLEYSVDVYAFNGILVNITLEQCGWFDREVYRTAKFETGNLAESTFGTAFSSRENESGLLKKLTKKSCSDMLYIWGYHDTSPGPVTNISAVGCNNSVELVDVTLSLSEPDLTLDLSDEPATIESTVRDIGGPGFSDSLPASLFYQDLASLPTTDDSLFDPFFSQLVTSRYAIPVSAIGDPTQADIVLDAIRLQHGIIEAQFLNSNFRVDINSPTAMENASALLIPMLFNQPIPDGTARYPATVTYPFGNHRVVQDPTATAVLEALLLGILTLVMLGWYLGPSEPALPRSPSSVGSLLALLAGGNLLERLYDGGPEPLCWDNVKSRLGKDSKLYLGWSSLNRDEGVEQRRFGIWITE